MFGRGRGMIGIIAAGAMMALSAATAPAFAQEPAPAQRNAPRKATPKRKGAPSAAARRWIMAPLPKRRLYKAIRKSRGEKPRTYKGSASAKRATARGGNHARF